MRRGLRPRNIRSRLALSYSIAVGVTVVAYAFLVFAVVRSHLLGSLDAQLRSDFESVEHALSIAEGGDVRWTQDAQPSGHHHDEHAAPAWAEVADATGRIVLRQPTLEERGSGPFRTFSSDYSIEGLPVHIRVGRSRTPLDDKLHTLAWLLAASIVPVVLLAYFVGRLLARRALQPIDEMTQRARTISADALSERLPVANPDDELGRLAGVFNDAFARLETSFEELRRFSSDAAHELRTPLAALRSVGEVALGRALTIEEARSVMASQLEEVDRMSTLVDDLLTLSRGDAGAVVLDARSADLLELARDVCEQLEVLAQERGQELRLTGESDVMVQADSAALRRAVRNLIDNAIQYAPTGTEIRVQVTGDHASATVEVSDDGPGISPEDQGRIFDRFVRVDASRTGRGTGLGLAIVRSVVALHGGRVELQSSPGRGATFRIVLRLASLDH